MQSGGAAWFNRVQSMDVGSSIFVANSAVQECGALEMNQCTGNVHDSIFSWNKVRRVEGCKRIHLVGPRLTAIAEC